MLTRYSVLWRQTVSTPCAKVYSVEHYTIDVFYLHQDLSTLESDVHLGGAEKPRLTSLSRVGKP